jgi:hypothetical protein
VAHMAGQPGQLGQNSRPWWAPAEERGGGAPAWKKGGERVLSDPGLTRSWQGRSIGPGRGRRRWILARRSSGLIRLKRIYNFWCSMLVFTPFV